MTRLARGPSVVHLIAPGPLAGAEKVVLGGTAAQAGAGLQVTLVVLGDRRCPEHAEVFAASAREAGVEVELLVTRGRLDLSVLWRLTRQLVRRRPTALHAHGYKALTYAVLASPLGRPPIVAHQHGTTEHDAKVRLYERLAVALCRAPAVRRILVPGSAMADRMVAAGVTRRLVEVVPNFVSLSTVPAPVVKSGPTPRALVLGRVSVEKGIDTLLDALGGAPGLAIEVTIVGDGPARAALEERAGADPRIRWVGHVTDVGAYLADADLLVLPSYREGLPMTLLEAAACGLPVVASAVGSVPDLVTDGANGRLVQPGDPAALGAALIDLTDHLAHYRDEARRRAPEVRERFSASGWAAHTARIYATLGAGPS